MRRLMLIFISLLLLLSILVQEAPGIPETSAPKVTDSVKRAHFYDDVGDSSIMCKGTDPCLESAGRIRKLVTKPTTSTTSSSSTPPKYDKNDHENGNAGPTASSGQVDHSINDTPAGDKVETFPVHSSTSTMTNQHLQHQHDVLERFPDVLDIAGMDYSPARRKPSIHN